MRSMERSKDYHRLNDVVIELFTTKCMPILLCGLDAYPASLRQFRSLNYVVVSCGRKIVNP